MKDIYKKTSNGLVQFWRQEISEDGTKYRTVTGKLNGAEVCSEWTEPTEKNVGKSNHTTIQEQVILEVNANYKKKLAQGNYKECMDNLDKDNYFKPMLAKTYGDDVLVTQEMFSKHTISSQPKLDGVRCIIDVHGMWSRQGKEIISAPHIYDAVKHIFTKYPEIVLDGELYTHRLRDDFDTIISLVRKSKPTTADLEESKQNIEFWMYDIQDNSGDVFSKRIDTVRHVVALIDAICVKSVDTTVCESMEQLSDLYGTYMENGYEGQMVRLDTHKYENKRSKSLLKRKEFVDEEFVLHDVKEGVGNRSGMAGRVEYVLQDGRVVGAGIRGSFAFFQTLLREKDKHIGNLVTIRYQNLTPDGVPRFAVATKFWGTPKRLF